jgi:hypothetical protein
MGRKSGTESTKRSEETSGALFILRFYPQDACRTKKEKVSSDNKSFFYV